MCAGRQGMRCWRSRLSSSSRRKTQGTVRTWFVHIISTSLRTTIDCSGTKSYMSLLLPLNAIPSSSTTEWRPSRHPDVPLPPPVEEPNMAELEMAAARQSMDGRPIKKTRPRRTVDFNGSMGRWHLVSKCLIKRWILELIHHIVTETSSYCGICAISKTCSSVYY